MLLGKVANKSFIQVNMNTINSDFRVMNELVNGCLDMPDDHKDPWDLFTTEPIIYPSQSHT